MRKLPLLMFLLWLVSDAFSMQIKRVVDNETTTAKISTVDVTRIFVQNDRIKSVKGIKGAYTRENDEKNGEIYIQPTPMYQEHAFTVLLETEQGRHFTLLLNPTSSPSETLMLVPAGVGHERAARFEQAYPYELTIKHLIHAMKNGDVPEGYYVREMDSKTTYKFGKLFTAKLKTIYEGLNLRGEIYEVKNRKAVPIQLDERQFYRQGTRAISLDSSEIPPMAKINFYRIVSHD